MFSRAVSDINWSAESYSTRDLMSKYPAPLLVRVTQGHCGLEDVDSLGQGQVIRIHQWLKQQRVIAIDSRGRPLSIPLDFNIPFEVLPDRKRSLFKRKTMFLVDIIRQYPLPKKVRFSSSHLTLSDALEGARLGIRMTLEALELIRIQEEVYLRGNAVNFGDLDPSILSIPVHHDLEMSLALGLRSSERDWHRLMRELDNVVAKKVRFPAVQGNNKITICSSEVDDENSHKLTRKNPVVQRRQQSLGRTYGTLRKKTAEKEHKQRPYDVSEKMGSLVPNGMSTSDVRGTNRRFVKRNEARRKQGIDRTDTVSISGTSTSATSVSESVTDDMSSVFPSSNSEVSNMEGEFDDDISDITTEDDIVDVYTPTPFFGSVSTLSKGLFRPEYWSGRYMDDSYHAHHAKRGSNNKSGHGRRLSTATSFSMNDINIILGGLDGKRDKNVTSHQRDPPDGRSLHSGRDIDDDANESTDL
ncbi:uncharacterized protein LOC110987413 [Acanthaster planci]|uniref:Uncharacterized protein LOC110987413 n=1 Tax=Acanthaster planci TaxID=133434 RepID=A0A8B7ZJL3_ACAPL|nr:uncharacterized protein LOC110987413 [Acanthaster planci]